MEPIRTPGKQPTFSQIVKHPVSYALYVIVAVFTSLIWWLTTQNDNCREELAKAQAEKDKLITAILVKNGIINEVKKANDSLRTEVKK
ncbi:hypothetical protein SAMN05444682_1273 [Parapedobacter indicus]|uniref:Uncharacterized protein n=1 Tax=Parapedobacter indicus TaxID=1477437 RepID=A0A1I3VTQ5_9SPHI|nr:hypothetical protein CLV26_1253 [Parapedobacter indicus]SFJ98615.1 hypothetical protein SAMN05444682_1273 [Parapedobacter indicus]